MEVHFAGLKSVTIGINLDENMRVKEAGLVTVNEKPFHSGTLIEKLLKKNPLDSYSLISPLYPLSKGLHGEEVKAFNYSIQSFDLCRINTASLSRYIIRFWPENL